MYFVLLKDLYNFAGMERNDTMPVEVYAESTPNPQAIKFVVSKNLIEAGSVEYLDLKSAANSPLAVQLFSFDGVQSVFITSNFVTVSKKISYEWIDLMPLIRKFIHGYLQSGEPVFTGPTWQKSGEQNSNQGGGKINHRDNEVEEKIIGILEEYVRPAVEQDGGAIHFKSYDSGIVTLVLKGSCSGCPSAIVTLKSGIERLLQQMIPEVKEVVAEEQ